MTAVTYFAVYRSDTSGGNPEDGFEGICVGLFGDVEDAITEARRLLAEGFHVMMVRGAMSQAEWDALDEVPNDFVASQPAATEASS